MKWIKLLNYFKFVYIILLSILYTETSSAQIYIQNIRGTVKDRESQQPLSMVKVSIINHSPSKIAQSDINGNFKIDSVFVGRYHILFQLNGYKDYQIPDVIINSGKETIIQIELEVDVKELKTINIRAKTKSGKTNNDLVLISGNSFTIDQTQRYAGSLGDPSRMASNFAGVSGSGNDQRNDIVIRGNSPLGLLWRLEGTDIPNPNHFTNPGANGGPISILNNNTLANSDFLTGSFPVEYGNATSGVFDLKIRDGNNSKHEKTGQVSMAGFEFILEGPIKNKSSYLISYRYSALNLFNALGFKFGNSGIPNYQDLTFKINVPTKKFGTVAFFGVGGKSGTKIYDAELSDEKYFQLSNAENTDFNSKMGVIGMKHTIPINKNSYCRTTISLSGEGNFTNVDTLNQNRLGYNTYYRNSISGKFNFHSFYNTRLNIKNSLKIGVNIYRLYFNMLEKIWLRSMNIYRNEINSDSFTWQYQTYINWLYKPFSNLTINSGINFNYLYLNKTFAVDPRMSIKWQISSKFSSSLGISSHSQAQPMLIYFQNTIINNFTGQFWLSNLNLGMQKCYHMIFGNEWMPNQNVKIKAEVYYQYLTGQAISNTDPYYSTINYGRSFGFPNRDSLVNKGIGRNQGVELTIERYFKKGYYYLTSISLYKSHYQTYTQIWYPTIFNSNFVINALGGYEWKLKHKNILSVSIKCLWSGGLRYTPVNEQASLLNNKIILDNNQIFGKRIQDYRRVDFKIGFKKNGKKVTQEIAIDFQNLFNIQNVLNRTFDLKTGLYKTQYQMGLIPIPFYRIQF